mgnify:CR=1 FL=1
MKEKGEKNKKNKKAQMQIGFGMIFSVILIVVFIAFAIYGIATFIRIQKMAQVAGFQQDLQNDIDSAWRSTSVSQAYSYNIPKNIQQVCFKRDENENMYFVPDDYDGALLKNLDVIKTVTSQGSSNGRLCIDVNSGKLDLMIKKSYNENLVTITK